MRRSFIRIGALLLALTATARADAAPPNDDLTAAVVFSTVPFAHTDDTSEATNGPDDPSPRCHGGATVWYRFTPSVDQSVLVSTAGSDYDTFVSVYAGSPRTPSAIQCAAMETALFQARARTHYLIVVSAPAGQPGGHLAFEARPSPFTLSIDPIGMLDPQSESATVRATLTCAEPVAVFFDRLALSQRSGYRTIRGADSRSGLALCDPAEPLEVTGVLPGAYRGGRAHVTAELGLAFGGSVGEVRARSAVMMEER